MGPPWHYNGISKVVAELCKRLSKSFEIEIFCTNMGGEQVGDSLWEDIPVHTFKGHGIYGISPTLYSELKKKVKSFDLIYAHGFSTFPILATILTNRNLPLILQPHFHPPALGLGMARFLIRKFHDQFLGEYIFNETTKILCVSETEREWLCDRFAIERNKISKVGNGVWIEPIHEAEPYEINYRLLLYVGRLVKYKNVQFIIEAMKYLPQEYRLLIIGDGKFKPTLQKRIYRLGLGHRVSIMSGLPNEQIYRWMKTCSLLINLSEREAFGLTVLEALAAGKPVIVNYRGGLAELADKFKTSVFPIKVDKSSREELAKLIVEKTDAKVVIDNLIEHSWDNVSLRVKRILNELNKRNT